MPFDVSEQAWSAAKQEVRRLLGAVAARQRTITYSGLAQQVKTLPLDANDPRLHALLGDVSSEENVAGRGMLSALVVHKQSGMARTEGPGEGFYRLARELGRRVPDKTAFWVNELKAVYAVWREVQSLEHEEAPVDAEGEDGYLGETPAEHTQRYWWVNPAQGHPEEVAGGYIWHPFASGTDGQEAAANSLGEVSPGDLVFACWESSVQAWGLAQSYAYDAPRPADGEGADSRVGDVGYRVECAFEAIARPVLLAPHMRELGHLLADGEAPIARDTGSERDGVHIGEVSSSFAAALIEILGGEGASSPPSEYLPAERRDLREEWEDALCATLRRRRTLPETEKTALVLARRGQGRFRDDLCARANACPVSGITNPVFLVASHIKPWRLASDEERLDPENGLLLAPHVDFLFDRGFISFEDDGTVVFSPGLDQETASSFGFDLSAPPCGAPFAPAQAEYLRFHRAFVLRGG